MLLNDFFLEKNLIRTVSETKSEKDNVRGTLLKGFTSETLCVLQMISEQYEIFQ